MQYLFTYRDAIEHCVNFAKRRGAKLQDGAISRGDVLQSIAMAYREMPAQRAWSYFQRLTRLQIVAPYDTGTITYDHTGGTYENQLSLAGGTWPTWAANGEVVIADVPHRVKYRISGTVLQLDPVLNPGADVDSGTEYRITRNLYALPNDFVQMGTPALRSPWGPLQQISPDTWLSYQSIGVPMGTPQCYAIVGDPQSMGNLAVALYPSPLSESVIDIPYTARPRPLAFTGYGSESKGDVTTTAASATVTGEATAFTAAMEGSVIRFSANTTTAPTPLDGINPFTEEGRIRAIASATSLSLVSSASQSLSRVKYLISDPIDFEPGMLEAFLRCCELKVMHVFGLKGYGLAKDVYQEALIQAFEQDSRSNAIRVAGMGNVPLLPTVMQR